MDETPTLYRRLRPNGVGAAEGPRGTFLQQTANVEILLTAPADADRVVVLGPGDRNLKMIRESLGVSIGARAGQIRLSGDRDAVRAARAIVDRLFAGAANRRALSRPEVLDVITEEAARANTGGAWQPTPASNQQDPPDPSDVRFLDPGMPAWEGPLVVRAAGRPIKPKTERQQQYVEAIRTKDLVFGIGPAGTGKTYLAVAAAVHLLRIDRVRKIILARPAVEAGEKLGFLPGDLEAKINPYLRPLLDALHDMMDFATIRRFMDSDVLEVSPLAFMRGRTLNHAVIILDEAQNTTRGQMQMFLTRMGHGSKMIVTGDTTQIDLPDPTSSGLIDAVHRLKRVPGVAITTLDGRDVVRHTLVQRIVEAYGERDAPSSAGALKGDSGAGASSPGTGDS